MVELETDVSDYSEYKLIKQTHTCFIFLTGGLEAIGQPVTFDAGPLDVHAGHKLRRSHGGNERSTDG